MRPRRYSRRHASVSTSRSVEAMKSISSWPQMSGGDSWTTGITPVVGPADQPGLEEGAGQEAAQQPLGLVVVEGEARLLVLDELNPVEEARAAHVADDRQVQQAVQGAAERGLVRLHVLQDVLALEDVEVGQRHGAADRVPGEGEPVQEGRPRLQEGLHEAVRGDHRPERRIPRGQALGHRDDVGLVVVAQRPEPVAEAPEGADDLVGDEEHAVAVADLAHALEVPRRWREAAAGVLHRLEEDRGHGVGALPLNGPLYFVGGPLPERNLVVGEELGPVEVGVGHLDGAGHERLERCAQLRDARDGQRAHGRAVVGDGAADDLGALRLPLDAEVLTRQLPGRLHRL